MALDVFFTLEALTVAMLAMGPCNARTTSQNFRLIPQYASGPNKGGHGASEANSKGNLFFLVRSYLMILQSGNKQY